MRNWVLLKEKKKSKTLKKVILKNLNQVANNSASTLPKKDDGLGAGGNGEVTKISQTLSFSGLHMVNVQ